MRCMYTGFLIPYSMWDTLLTKIYADVEQIDA